MSEGEIPSIESSGSDPELNRLVTECLERFEREGIGAIDAICAQNPVLEGKLRRRVGMLRAMGLITDNGPGADDEIPERLGDFRLLRRLGSGGMGVVFLAEQTSLKRRVALKLIRPEHLYFPGAKDRFRREAEAVARLTHPGIVPIHVVGEAKGLPYYAMDVVEGCSLTQILERVRGRNPADLTGADFAQAVADAALVPAAAVRLDAFGHSWTTACLGVIAQVAQALAHAHERGVLHRDLKPSNVMVTPDGRALLLDFGLACVTGETRITKSGSQLGSLTYMPPEACWQDGTVDARSDVYSLSVTLYELLTLVPPFQGNDISRLQTAIVGGSYQPIRSRNAAVPWDAETVCQKGMDCEAARRYATAAAFHDDLRAVLELRPIAAARPSVALRVRRYAQRHPARALAVAIAVLALILGPWAYAVVQRRANERLREEQQRTAQQRTRAEDLLKITLDSVERMQLHFGSDLLEDIPGTETLRDELFHEALDLYAKVADQAGDDPRLRLSRGQTERRRGETLAQLGIHDEATTWFARAEATLAAPFDDSDEERRAQLERAEVLLARGSSEMLRGRDHDALPVLERARALMSALGHAADVKRDEAMAFARILQNLATAYSDAGRLDEALSAVKEGMARLEQVELRGKADDVFEALYGQMLTNVGTIYSAMGKTDQGIEALREALDAGERQLEDHRDLVPLRMAVAGNELNYGHVLHIADRDRKQAQAHVERSIELFKELTADYPQSPRYAIYLAQGRNLLAEILMFREEFAAADAVLVENDAELARGEDRMQDKALLHKRRAASASIWGSVKLCMERPDEAREQFERSLTLLEEFGVPDTDVKFVERLRSIGHQELAKMALADGEGEAALVDIDAAIAAIVHARSVNSLDLELTKQEHQERIMRVNALLMLGRVDDMRAELKSVVALNGDATLSSIFSADVYLRALRQELADNGDEEVIAELRTDAIESLKQAVALGGVPRAALATEPDCDPVRDDPRFQALLTEE